MTSADGNDTITSQLGSLEIGKETATASGSKGAARGKGGGSRQDASPTVQLSKALSYILRHGAAKEHLKMSTDGYISLDAVLARPKLSKIKMEHGSSPTPQDVMQVVETNDKKRFEVSKRESDQLFIRAVQGHSISEVSSMIAFDAQSLILTGSISRSPLWIMSL
jgi:2'-phosphotransferase